MTANLRICARCELTTEVKEILNSSSWIGESIADPSSKSELNK